MTEVCIKQVPKSRVTNFANLEGRRFPLEFVMHVNAAKASHGVVKVLLFQFGNRYFNFNLDIRLVREKN